MQDRWEHHPRADVIGQIANKDGAKAELFMKELDFARGVRVFAYPDAVALIPLCALDYRITGDSVALPDYLEKYLPGEIAD